ncbi:g protein-coupled receptor [Anaeramoeba ignava]|uniref:G protein-coupled receptor n=1 Tax=Anaeramoeba ignava TaxID=1746090 RepID=A0A9Q0LBI0_ANAIG|nr:g protein-coupled receptor [Anaeramoeba ignava]
MATTLVIIFCFIGASLGILGSLSFIITYSILPEIRTRFRLYILTLSIYNFISGITALFPGYKGHTICCIQTFLVDFAFICVCCWIFLISLVYYLQICRNFDIENSSKFYWISIIIIQIISLTISLIVILFGEPETGFSYWCSYSKNAFIITEYSIFWFCLIGALIFYSIVVHKIRKDQKINYPKSFQIKMLTLAILYIITELWTTIERIIQVIQKVDTPNEFLVTTQAFFSPLLGFWDFIFFGLGDKFVRALLIRKFKKKKSQDIIELNQELIKN